MDGKKRVFIRLLFFFIIKALYGSSKNEYEKFNKKKKPALTNNTNLFLVLPLAKFWNYFHNIGNDLCPAFFLCEYFIKAYFTSGIDKLNIVKKKQTLPPHV